jgi:ABC-type ATPase with predicted acetyltransferase domain
LRPGTITLLGGASGAGKSTLLRAVLSSPEHRDRTVIDLATLATRATHAAVPVVDCFDGLPLRDALQRLARVGLGEAWTYLRTPAELSEGQRWRFRLAVALHRAANASDTRVARPLIVCDEFAAVLDRVTACVVAHRLRRAIDATPNVAAVVATSHDDLVAALGPDVVIRCDFGRHEVVERPKMK